MLASRRSLASGSWLLAAILVGACGSKTEDIWMEPVAGATSAGTGGVTTGGSGGTTSAGGSGNGSSTGGAAGATGGVGAAGSGSGTGGAPNGGTGGSGASGGSSGSGSEPGSGGSDATGGTPGTGGAQNGGSAGSGTAEGGAGAEDTGGAPAVGGATSGGGAGIGGSVNTGGAGGTSPGGGGGTAGTGGSSGSPGFPLVAPVFDGESAYVEIPDADIFSEPTSGELTVEAWMRPDSLDMPEQESSGYVHWLGKGVSGEHEWVARMYQRGNDEERENRISFYSFNLNGGLGAGSYFQDDVRVGEWIHYVGSFDDVRTYIYKNGDQRDSDLLSGYDVTPRNGDAPVRIATRDRNSYFQGSIARVAFYSTRLSEQRIAAHYAAAGPGYDAVILAEPSLVAYYPLSETSGEVAFDAKGDHDGEYHGEVGLGKAEWPNP